MTLHQDHHEPKDTDPTQAAQTLPAETPSEETLPPEMPTATDPPAEVPPVKRRRRRRPNGRWSDPATPLQAARFQRRLTAKEVVAGIRKLCPGHGDGQCKIDLSKISDYEHATRRPGIDHIEAFCKFYGKSPEALGLIRWRDQPPPQPEAIPPASPDLAPRPCDHDGDPERLLAAWLRESAVSIATAVLTALARCPIALTSPEPLEQPGTPPDAGERTDSADTPG